MHLVALPVYQRLQNSKGALCPFALMSVEDTLLRQPSDLMFLLYLLAENLSVHLATCIFFAEVQEHPCLMN